MMPNQHERYSELCALSTSGALSPEEQAELQQHLLVCAECREDEARYRLLEKEGIPALALNCGAKVVPVSPRLAIPWRAIAASLVLGAAGYGMIHFAYSTDSARKSEVAAEHRVTAVTSEKRALAEQVDALTNKLKRLESDDAQRREEIEKLRADLRAELQREQEKSAETAALSSAATSAKGRADEQLKLVARERDALAGRLHELEAAYQSAEAELVSLRADRDRVKLRIASLETENSVLTASNRDQERRLRDQEQYLSSDRDIRELMGARQLYMADVFDVSSDSRTRKPYGRIFYTKSKSLIFYAFDLDRQQKGGIKNAAFQAWGRNESSQSTPVNLGILYQDSEQNRRWVLRFDDPRQLAEIDAVFVTVEPHGGSEKPSGKPFLYASLRREPNHP